MPPLGDTLTFLGDVACPVELTPSIVGVDRLPFAAALLNLEGALCEPGAVGSLPPRALYNTTAILPVLRDWQVCAVTLANNHIMDARQAPSTTVRRLHAEGIASVGAGDTLDDARRPLDLHIGGRRLHVLAYNWEVIRHRSAGAHRPGANPLQPREALAAVRRAVAADPQALPVVVLHWDYELERYPLPAHRQLAFALIEAGAAAIVGHHPHCVHGIEWHLGRPIVYSVGDWFLPQGFFFGQPIHLPDYTLPQLAFEWSPSGGAARCHWFEYDRSAHVIRYLQSEPADTSQRVRELTPFAGMPHGEYVRWFAAHRVKTRGLPIYRDYRHTFRNLCRDWYCGCRSWMIRQIAARGLR